MNNGTHKERAGWRISLIASSCGTAALLILLLFSCIHFVNQKKGEEKAAAGEMKTEAEAIVRETKTEAEDVPAETEPVTAEGIFRAYIQQELIPAYGLFETPQQGDMRRNTDKWLKPSGILSAGCKDLDGDGEEELVVLHMQQEGEEYGLRMDVYETVDGAAVLADSKPVEPFIEERVDTSGALSMPEDCWTTILWDVTAVEVQGQTYLVCESQQVWSYFANGSSQDYWAYIYNGKELEYACSFTQTAGGSSDFEYHGYEFQEGELKGGELLYSEWYDTPGKYDSFEEALKSLFGKYGIQTKAQESGWSNESILSEANEMERILEFSNTMIEEKGSSFDDRVYTFEAKVLEDAGLRENITSPETEDAYTSHGSETTEGTLNNGGKAVRHEGYDYYWKYSSGSRSDTGLFAYYSGTQDVENQMVRRTPDGAEEVLFSAVGCGDLYILGDRMYLTEDGDSKLYSVKMDGSGRKDYGWCRVCGADGDAENLLVLDSSAEDGSTWLTLIRRDGSREQIQNGSWNYVDTVEGYAYFSDYDYDTGRLTLSRYKVDGTEEMQEMDSIALNGSYDSQYASVLQVTALEDTVYYSYGSYAGTGLFFQEGGINSVRMDGSGAQVCVEQGGITAQDFQVTNEDGDVRIYYVDDSIGTGSLIGYWSDAAYDGSIVKNLSTGQISQSDFCLSRPGSYVYLDGEVVMLEENQTFYRTVLPKDRAAAFGCGDFNSEDSSIAIIRDLEIVGDCAYFAVEKSLRDKQGDMGWRPGYRRENTDCYRMSLGDGQLELLYSY